MYIYLSLHDLSSHLPTKGDMPRFAILLEILLNFAPSIFVSNASLAKETYL